MRRPDSYQGFDIRRVVRSLAIPGFTLKVCSGQKAAERMRNKMHALASIGSGYLDGSFELCRYILKIGIRPPAELIDNVTIFGIQLFSEQTPCVGATTQTTTR